MNFITQYILQKGISEDIFILILSIPIIFIVITFARRVIGSATLGTHIPLSLTLLLVITGLKNGVIIFVFIFISMLVIRSLLRPIKILTMTDSRVLDAITFCVLVVIIILGFLYIPLINNITLNIIILFLILVISTCSQNLIITWESRGLKQFIPPFIEFSILMAASYFLITWTWIQNLILEYPLGIIIFSIIVISLLARWEKLKIKEYIRFREVIKHVELSEKK